MSELLPLIAGNWKMNTTVPDGVALATDIRMRVGDSPTVDVVLFPPFTHLWPVADAISHSPIKLGAQNCFWESSGAFTGEVSPVALSGLCEWVLVGHSERRHLLGESDEQVTRKVHAALATELKVILAVGETQDERSADATKSVVDRQLQSLAGVGEQELDRIAIAYEPVWAIGTGLTATSEQAEEVCAHISGRFPQVRVIYGGSVTAANAAALLACEHISGALVGGASLRADEFAQIVASA
jgi:triosephosphate isomerase (TIM)